MISFTMETYQNEYLPAGGTEVNAILSISAQGVGESTAADAPTPELLIIDVSGSMAVGGRLPAARDATCAAIDCIRDGVPFAVIAGNHAAHLIFPGRGLGLATASPGTRAAAKGRVRLLRAAGNTAMGDWLLFANHLLEQTANDRGHAILLTDGENRQHPGELEAALAACEGRFQCDCRGVGTDWHVAELRRIADVLLGTVDIIAHPRDMAADFEAIMRAAMGRQSGDVWLEVWTPQGATTRFVKQVAPAVVDLTDHRHAMSPLVGRYPLGAWGAESREYHVSIETPAQDVGEEMLAARVGVVVEEETRARARIRAIWTNDRAQATRINRVVAHFTGQSELARAIQEGLEARRAGDDRTATVRLGHAVQLASGCGNEATMNLLAAVVDVDDAATGRVRLKPVVSQVDEMTLDTRSTKTVRVPSELR